VGRCVPRCGYEPNVGRDLQLTGECLQDAGCFEGRELLARRRSDELRQPVKHCWRRPVLPLAVRDEVSGARKGRLPAPDQAADVIEMPMRDDDQINVCRIGTNTRELTPKPTPPSLA